MVILGFFAGRLGSKVPKVSDGQKNLSMARFNYRAHFPPVVVLEKTRGMKNREFNHRGHKGHGGGRQNGNLKAEILTAKEANGRE